MLALQPSRRQQPWGFSDGIETSLHDPYLASTMNSYQTSFDPTAGFLAVPFNGYNGSSAGPAVRSDTADLALFASEAAGSFNPRPQLRSESSSASASSLDTTISSVVDSPHFPHVQAIPGQERWSMGSQGLGPEPTIVSNDPYDQVFEQQGLNIEGSFEKAGGNFVDPSLIQPSSNSCPDAGLATRNSTAYAHSGYGTNSTAVSPIPSHTESIPQVTATHLHPGRSPHIFHNSYKHSPYLHRRGSVASTNSRQSQQSPRSGSPDLDAELQDKGRCPHPDCGRVFKDLKAHMLTHQPERPEKCPIANCEYNQKGFARKYDKNRHTLTHYKGNMVCGFCPGSGSAVEKSFNRADVFKRHLTSVHGVEQSPPNSRKRCHSGIPKKVTSYCQTATSGKCSTCSSTFSNAQDFYEHLDDCVLRVVQQEEPSEAINHQNLAEIAADEAVKATVQRHLLADAEEAARPLQGVEADDDHDDDHDDGSSEGEVGKEAGGNTQHEQIHGRGTARLARSGLTSRTDTKGGVSKASRPALKTPMPAGVVAPTVGKRSRRRKDYPASWGMALDQMKMKKRVLRVYDGERPIWKDAMMLNDDLEVRVNLADGKSYITDLDIATLKRGNAPYSASGIGAGPWTQPEVPCIDLEALMA